MIASGIARRASRTGPGAGPGPEDRAGPGEPDQDQGPAPDQTSRAGPARPAPPRPPARPGQGQTRTRPAVPDHQTAPAQDSTHTHAGANQNRTRGRRYSLDTPRRLRVRERRIFLGVRGFFQLPPVAQKKSWGTQKSRASKIGGGCKKIFCVATFCQFFKI